MFTSTRGLGGSMPGEDVLRSARALSKGLRETEVPKEIIDTVSNLDTFIKEQQITQAKVAALCQGSALLEDSAEFSKIQQLVELAPEGKDILEKTGVALESINASLRDMQVNVNLVWQKTQIAGLPVTGGAGQSLVNIGRASSLATPKLNTYFEATMRRLEEQVLLQQRRLDELMSAVSSPQDPASVTGNIPDVILSLNQSIICLAAKIAERHEAVGRLSIKHGNGSINDFDEISSYGSLQRLSTNKPNSNVGINAFQLAAGSSYSTSGFNTSSSAGPPLTSVNRPLTGPFETTLSSLPSAQPLGGAIGSSSFGGLRLNSPAPPFGASAFGSTAASNVASPQIGGAAIRPWSSDTTNNRFSASFSPGGAGLLDAGKRSRAL